jgi:cytidine deaminase
MNDHGKDLDRETRLLLIEAAKGVQGGFLFRPPDKDFAAGGVGAALLTVEGNVYTGICIDLSCGLGFCAEVAAIAEMVKHRETQIVAVVAVDKSRIVPPCGRCRETMLQVNPRNLDARVILSEDRDVPLRELLPECWL